MSTFVTGIQQCGIGVLDANEAALYYKELFGFSAIVFDDVAEAHLMTRYTGGKIYKRRAILTMNMQGGGGLEMWQFTDRKPLAALQKMRAGDLGINAIKIKTKDIAAAYNFFITRSDVMVLTTEFAQKNADHFWLRDKYQNIFQIVKKTNFFSSGDHVCGGVCGAVIGVSDIPKAVDFYCGLFGFEVSGKQGLTNSFLEPSLKLKQIILQKPEASKGAFSALLGETEIELLQIETFVSVRVFANRYWGDLGFIHLCFDVIDMDKMKHLSTIKDQQFTVDSEGFFEMERSGGRFCYMEDPDGTLIELVQTYKVPILKKLGVYLNLHKRRNNKPLPRFIVKLLGLNKLMKD